MSRDVVFSLDSGATRGDGGVQYVERSDPGTQPVDNTKPRTHQAVQTVAVSFMYDEREYRVLTWERGFYGVGIPSEV